jgi:hypothetical protein
MSTLRRTRFAVTDPSNAATGRKRPQIRLGERRYAQEVIDELFVTSICIVTATSVFRCFSQRRHVRLSTEAVNYIPWPPVLFPTLPRDVAVRDMGESSVEHLEEIYTRLIGLLHELPVTADWLVAGSATPDVWKKRADQWADLCGDVRLFLLVLCESNSIPGFRKWARGLEIEQLLKFARYGGTPCLRSDGVIITPIWFDERREPRVPMNLTSSIECGGTTSRVVLRDLSLSGFCVTSAPSLPNGSVVTLSLPSGQQLRGQVMWSCGGSLGVKSDIALDENGETASTIRRFIAAAMKR